MTNLKFDKEITALLVIDPYNDFISEGGKIWDRIKAVAEANDCVPNMLQVLKAARQAETSRFLCDASSVPSRRLRDLAVHCAYPESGVVAKILRIRNMGRRDPLRIHSSAGRYRGSGALVFQWVCQHRSGFELKRHGIHKLIVIGLIAHTCVESTVRFAAELGYEVTVVRTRRRITRRRCTPHSSSISQTTRAGLSQRRKSLTPF